MRLARGRHTNIRRKMRRVAMLVLSASTALSAAFVAWPKVPIAAAQTVQAQTQLQFVKEDIVTSGAVVRTYKWYPASSLTEQSTDLRVLVIDLHNPYVQLDVMSGRNGQLNSKQSVLGMARETGAVAGVNASFFHMDVPLPNPLGMQVSDHELTVSPLFLSGWHTFGITADRRPVIGEYAFDGIVVNSTGAAYELRGINKPLMWDENHVQSHTNSIFMYTSVWGDHPRAERSHFKPTEVLVVDGIVTQMSIDEPLEVRIPENGYLLRGEGEGAAYLQENVVIGEPLQAIYQLVDLATGERYEADQFQMLIGGHTLLVDQGQATEFTANIANISGTWPAARTAAGYSADGRYVYLLTADRAQGSRGMTLAELQQAMVELGIWRGLNLDGGGSTTMVARELGDTSASLVNRPSQTTMRQVVNGIGVYTTAPQGKLAGLIMDSLPFLFVGERVELPLRGYDEFYNPVTSVDITQPGFHLEVTDGYGRFEAGAFVPTRQGTATITVANDAMQVSTDVEIVNRKDIESLVIETTNPSIRSGSMIEMKVKSRLKDGRSREVPTEAIEWKIEGFQGYVEDGMLTVEEVEEYATARVIATYDGLSTSILLPTYVSHLWANFDTVMPPLSLQQSDPLARVDYQVTNRIGEEETASNVLAWQYDYSSILQMRGEELPKISFEFDRGAGVETTGQPNELLIDVYGDGKSSKLWIEATDANGTLHTIPVGKIDWNGWRTVEISLDRYKIEHPLMIQRLVHESPENPAPPIDRAFISDEDLLAMIDPTVTQGYLAIDNIIFQSVNEPPVPENKTIELQINNDTVSIDGQIHVIDQPPIIVNSSTMVPIRFIIEAMGGEVLWDADSRKVTLIRGRHLIEMWLDEEEMNFNGRKITAPVAPTVINSRTLVPVRVLSEHLGWDVYWDPDTQSVKLIGQNA